MPKQLGTTGKGKKILDAYKNAQDFLRKTKGWTQQDHYEARDTLRKAGLKDLADLHDNVSFYFGMPREMKLQATEHEKLGTFRKSVSSKAQVIAKLVGAGHEDLAEQLVNLTVSDLLIATSTGMAVGALTYDVVDDVLDAAYEAYEDAGDPEGVDTDFIRGSNRKVWAAKIEAMAEKKYRSDKKFAKQMRSLHAGRKNEKMLAALMKEWVLDMLKKGYPAAYKLLPRSFHKQPVKL